MLYVGYVMQEAQDKAVTVLDRLLKVEPDGRMRIAQALLQTGQVDGAMGLLEKELEARPDRIEVAITLGQIYHLGKRAADVARLRKAIEAKGDASVLDAFDKALAEIEKQAEAAPGEAPGEPTSPPPAGSVPMVGSPE